jgi:hypothetical protein
VARAGRWSVFLLQRIAREFGAPLHGQSAPLQRLSGKSWRNCGAACPCHSTERPATTAFSQKKPSIPAHLVLGRQRLLKFAMKRNTKFCAFWPLQPARRLHVGLFFF